MSKGSRRRSIPFIIHLQISIKIRIRVLHFLSLQVACQFAVFSTIVPRLYIQGDSFYCTLTIGFANIYIIH